MSPRPKSTATAVRLAVAALVVAGVAVLAIQTLGTQAAARSHERSDGAATASGGAPAGVPPNASPAGPGAAAAGFSPRAPNLDTSGFSTVFRRARLWEASATLAEVRAQWEALPRRMEEAIEQELGRAGRGTDLIQALLAKASLLNFRGDARGAYQVLERARAEADQDASLAATWRYSILYLQGVTALRCGENENCLECACRLDCSCIFPFAPDAIHQNPDGSRRAARHFTEYLEGFPDDLGVRWLLNLAHMTLGEHPKGVDPRFLIPAERFLRSDVQMPRFRNVACSVGVDRLNQAGGAIMDDFDGDSLLDLVVTSMDPAQSMAIYRNRGDGQFEERTATAGVADQLGGLNCVQADYDNDGRLDIFIPRGAWLQSPIRPTLLRNEGGWKFTDVTQAAGLIGAVNSNSAQWADYDNDGWLDLFVCCEKQANLLYRNRGDGTFEELASRAGVQGSGGFHKGCAWVDVDNDRFPDLFVTDLDRTATLYKNLADGTFRDQTVPLSIDGPRYGFSCWAWDYDNDGWLDLFATCYDRPFADVVRGLIGEPRQGRNASRLFRNRAGTGFVDVTQEAGLDAVYTTMGSNYADFDNDGFLDMYLGTGDPEISMLVPNRMLQSVAGKRFADVTASSGTGHLQKGHGVACGDWDRDGDLDLFIELGGAIAGDRFHNALFENPGHGNHWLTVQLVGKKTNRSALGARIHALTEGPEPASIYRHVSSGSSFGANPLEQMLGLGTKTRVARLEVYWPTSDTRQVFHDLAADRILRITELAPEGVYEVVPHRPVAPPK